jgi:hypothetical protein
MWGCLEGPACMFGKLGFIYAAENLNSPTTFSDCGQYQY